MRMVLVSTITGLVVAAMFYLMFHPPTILRIIIFGGWGVAAAIYGMGAADRVRQQDGRMWWER